MDSQTISFSRQPLSTPAYAAALAKSGVQTLPSLCNISGTSDSFWAKYERGTLIRVPTFHLVRPQAQELSRVLRESRTLIASYLIEPDVSHPANASLYLCADQDYELHKLESAVRRNTRKGLRELRVAALSTDELLAHGGPAFCDARRRAGLSDGTPEEFARHFKQRTQCEGHVFLGAWKNDELAAFLSIVEVADWVEIHGCYSQDACLSSRPNNVLMYTALSHYLAEAKRSLVSYGLSSIQTVSKEAGLHAFKTKVGFVSKPVHRAFMLHPVIRPFMNRLTLAGMHTLLRMRPGNRLLKKAHGVCSVLVDKKEGNV